MEQGRKEKKVGRKKRRKEGKKERKKKGSNEGKKEAKKEGRKEGRKGGRKERRKDGWIKYIRLLLPFLLLFFSGRLLPSRSSTPPAHHNTITQRYVLPSNGLPASLLSPWQLPLVVARYQFIRAMRISYARRQ
jgi:hypothetical protein